MLKSRMHKRPPASGRGHTYNFKECANCKKSLARGEWHLSDSLVYDNRIDYIAYCKQCAETKGDI